MLPLSGLSPRTCRRTALLAAGLGVGLSLAAGLAATLLALALAAVLLPLIFSLADRLAGQQDVIRALESLARGDTPARLPEDGGGGTAALLRALNAAAWAINTQLTEQQAREARFRALAESACGLEAWIGLQGRVLWINPSVERITGYSTAECALATDFIGLLVYPKDQAYAQEVLHGALRGEASAGQAMRFQRKDGSLLWVALDWQPLRLEEGRTDGLRLSVTDIERRKQAELKLLETVAEVRRAQSLQQVYLARSDEERRRLEALLDVMRIGVLFYDNDRRVLHCNRAFLDLLGLPPDENLSGVRDEVILEHWAGLVADYPRYRLQVEAVRAGLESALPNEFTLTDGRIIAEITAPVAGPLPGTVSGRVWISEDVTEQRRAADRLTQLADRDPLTSLLNRRRFHEELSRMQAEADRRKVPFGLLAIDLDGFKAINDRFGHQAGDEVLTTLARAVGDTVRKNEVFFRLGGDEFAILAPDSGETEMVGLARRVSGIIIDQHWQFDAVPVGITASIGIAVYPRDAADGEELVARADAAMYQAKSSGRNAWHVFREGLTEDSQPALFR